MNNFIYENRTKVFFGTGCVKEFLTSLVKDCDTVMMAYGEGSVKKNGIYDEILNILIKSGKNVVEFSGIMPNPVYGKVMEGARLAKNSGVQLILGIGGAFESLSHIMETYFSEPDEQNVSDEIAEALMRSVIRNTRLALDDPENYMARSNLFWDSMLSENRLIKLGKKCDFTCHLMAHQLGAYTDCNHGQAVAVLHPAYYRHIYRSGLKKFARFARNVWGIRQNDKTDAELAEAGIEALSGFISEIGLPKTLRELGVKDPSELKEIADSCHYSQGSYRRLGSSEILEIFRECY